MILNPATRVVLCAVFLAPIASTAAFSDSFTEAIVSQGDEHSVRLTSENAVCIEGLVDGRWVTQFRSGDGRIPTPNELWTDPAFALAVGGVSVNENLSWGGMEDLETPLGRHVIVRLRNEAAGVEVQVHTALDGTPVMTRWLEVSNQSQQPLALTWTSPWSGRLSRGSDFHLGHFTKDGHSFEGWFKWETLPMWTSAFTSLKGQGHDAPFFVLRNDGTGEHFIASLEWTANWKMEFSRDLKGIVTFQFGPLADAPLRIIAPGETVATPAIHLGLISAGLDAAIQGMHEHVRRSVLPPRTEETFGLVQYVLPADLGFHTPFDETSARKCVDVAAAIGTELFILDAYWWDVTCDWTPSATRFPNGLEPLIEYVRSKGMRFGLYMEPEGGRGNIRESKVAAEHPDWLAPKDTINLAIPEARAWVESEIVRTIEQYDLDLFRVDYNAEETGGGLTTVQLGQPENNYWRYYEACYGMYGRIRQRFPKLLLQQCAGGGARNDLGMMRYFHENYLTDGLSIPKEHMSYAGQTLAFPPEQFTILHGATGHISPGYPENFDTILRTSYTLGTPQIFSGIVAPSLADLTPVRRDRFLHYADLYKDFIRPELATCRMYHHAPVSDTGGVEDGAWFAVEFASKDCDKGWATIVRIGPCDSNTYTFRPRGLDLKRRYKVRLDGLDCEMEASGMELMQGIPVRLEAMAMSELLLFEAQ